MEDQTMIAPPDLPEAPGGDATRVIQAPAGYAPGAGYAEATQQAITVTCPVCRTPNGPAERYCQDCGFMFGSAEQVEELPDVSQLPRLVDAASGRDFALNPGVNTVGRENADVLLIDPTVSRRHAQVSLENGQVIVEDLGSTNGTQVGGAPTRSGERATAFDGDVVRFGSVQLTLALPGGQARPADAAPAAAAPIPAAPPAEERGEPLAHLVLGDGTEYPLFAGVNSLGRRSGNQIVLADAFASGRHAEIHCEPGVPPQVIDLGSTNGTFIAGERLAPNEPVTLADASVLTFGKTPLTVRIAEAAPDPQPDAAAADSAEAPSPRSAPVPNDFELPEA